MLKKLSFSFFFVLFLINFNQAQTNLKVVTSNIGFKIKNAGLTVSGTLSDLESEINFSPELYKSSSIKASVAVNSINTGIDSRDNHLKKAEYFDAIKFPKITMISSFFGKDGNKYIGYFKLTIKGITKDITVPFEFENNIMKAEFSIDRRDFNIGGKNLLMGDKVMIGIQLMLSTKN
jgi:polyisoprenoid-binding protein YceI